MDYISPFNMLAILTSPIEGILDIMRKAVQGFVSVFQKDKFLE
jgi:hypothetical protein